MSTSARFHAFLAVAVGAFGVACVLFALGAVTQAAAHFPTSDPAIVRVQTEGVPFTVTLVAAPIEQTVGNNIVLTATVTDEYGNQVTDGTPVTFTVSRGNVLSPVPTVNGIATSLFSDTLVGTRAVTAASGSAPPDTQSVTFEPGEPFNIKLDARPSTLKVGWVSTLYMTVTDRYGNPVAFDTEIVLDADWGNVWSPVYTGEGGRASSNIVATQAGADHITASTLTAYTVTIVTFTPDVPKTVTLQAVPAVQIVGNNTVLTATVRDQYNNPVANGTPVTFTKDLGNLVPPVAQTTNGIATAQISSTVPGTAHVTAASGSAPPAPATVVFNPDEPDTVTLVAAPTSLVVGNNSVLTATVRDQYNNPVANDTPVAFTVSRGNVISPVPTTNGVATSLFSNTLVGTRVVTAASGSAPPDTQSVTFTAGPPFSITVQVNPVNMLANSGATARITATIADRYNNPLAGQMLSGSFPTTTMGTISGLGLTNSAGQAIGTWTAGTRPGQAPLRVTNGTITGSRNVALISGLPTTLTMQIGPRTLIANSSMTSPITVTVVDSYSTRLADIGVSGSTMPSTLGSVSIFNLTDDNGRAFGAWTAGSVVGTGLLRVNWTDNVAISASVTVSLTYGNVQTITLQVNPSTLAAFSGATAPITATVRDTYANLLPNIPLSGSTSPPTLGSVRWNGTTNPNGQVFGTWTATPSSAAGSGLIRACSGSVCGTFPIALTPGSIYQPLTLRPPELQNGYFSSTLQYWTVDPASKLSVTSGVDPQYPGDGQAALLGSPNYACNGGVPSGYGGLSQNIILAEAPAVLKFTYHIYTQDRNNYDPNWDQFEVRLNGILVLTDTNDEEGPYPDCVTLYNLGRQTASIPLTGNVGDTINLNFRVKNGPEGDHNFNTYVYVDNVRIEH